MKKIFKIIAVILSLISPIVVFGAPPYTFTNTLQPSTSVMDVGSTTLSAYRNIVAQWFTATSTRASSFPYASTTALSASSYIQFIGYSALPQLTAADITTGLHFDGPGIVSFHNGGIQTMLLSSINNVGIASSSPGQKLSVGGDIIGHNIIGTRFNATSTSLASLFPYASSTVISSTGNAYFATSGGSVGIGTSTPYSILSVSNNRNTPVNTSLFTIASTTNGLSTTTLLTVLGNGNTGIRNTNPGGLLDVGTVTSSGFGEANPAYKVIINDQTNGGASLILTNSGVLSATSSLIFKSPTTADFRTFSSGNIYSGFTTAGYTGSYLKLGSSLGANRYNDEITLTNGKVGIGTTSPETLLDVDGVTTIGTEGATTAQLIVKGGASGTNMITLLRRSGGTSQYSWSLAAGGLAFNDDINSRLTLNLFGDNSINQLYLGTRGKISADSNPISLLGATTYSSAAGSDIAGNELRLQAGPGNGAGTPGDLTFYTSSSLSSGTTPQTPQVRAVIKANNGNLGVGTTSPYAKLSVVGEAVMSSFNATSTTATSTIAGALKYGRTGVATLSSGAATVTVPLDSNSVIFLTVQNCGGSCGQVSVNSRTSSSFDIESTSGTDSSDVGWMVIQK